jgi:hypothetical protein
VYSCKLTDRGNSLFVLPEGTDENKLCIAVVDIKMLIQKKYPNDKRFITLLNEYIAQTAEEKHTNIYKNKFESKINEEVYHIEQEIELQKELFQKQLAPQIYEYYIDAISKMYILQEKCGISLVNYIDMYSHKLDNVPENENGTYNYKGTIIQNLPYTDEDVFNKIVDLTDRIANAGFVNSDIKPENTCTKIAQNGSLEDIIALDFDPNFFIRINLSTPGLVENSKIFMLTLIIAHLCKWRNMKFVPKIVVKHLTRTKIYNMIHFFVNNRLICIRDRHPLFMLYHYVIGLPKELSFTSCVDNQTPKKITYLTDEICKYIFFGVNGNGRGKTKGSKRTKRNKRSKRIKK